MDRSNPYEAAFEAYLKAHDLCYVGVNETRRSLLGGAPVKNLDFVVLGPSGARLLVDVKGRQFPSGPAAKPRYVWESWSTQEDVDGLTNWLRLFGDGYLALFAFVYKLRADVAVPADTPDLFRWRDQDWLLRAVTLEEYRRHLRVRSPKWGTVHVGHKVFRDLVRPFRWFSHELPREELPGHATDEDWDLSASFRHALAALPAGEPQTGSGGDRT